MVNCLEIRILLYYTYCIPIQQIAWKRSQIAHISPLSQNQFILFTLFSEGQCLVIHLEPYQNLKPIVISSEYKKGNIIFSVKLSQIESIQLIKIKHFLFDKFYIVSSQIPFYYLKNIYLRNCTMKSYLILLVLIVSCASVKFTPSFSLIKNTTFNSIIIHDQKIPDKIFAAEIHYSRIPHQYWQHRLQMVKAMGFNALSVYIMWNFHQIQKGKFDYENGEKNLNGFLELAKKYGFMILIRPGPFVCAEWDFGGMPARLLSIKNIKVRDNNKPFLDEVKIYFSSLSPIIKKYSHSNQGPIIMLQIENEYGFYGKDKTYISALRELWKQVGINDIPEYYVDWIDNIEISHWQGANIGINNGIRKEDWIKARQIEPKGYLFGGEIYSGWLTHWGESWQGKSIKDFTNEFNFLMVNNHSFSMYMAHGGSNFGLTAGANGMNQKPYDYGAHITSYDYDAPINQQGSPTSKYYIFRQLALKHATWSIPQVPNPIPTIAIKPFAPAKYADFLLNIPEPTLQSINELVVFEDQRLQMWNQGFVTFQTYLTIGTFQINITVHDFALVYLNGQFIKALDRSSKTNETLKFTTQQYVNTLMILVESMGHINFGHQMEVDYKGIINFEVKFKPNSKESQSQKLDGSDFLWNITKIPIDENMLNWKNRSDKAKFPHLFKYTLTLDQVGDTYLNMERWGKGYVFVNGHNLGRYWQKGPQERVYLPGVWLKKGENEVIVLQILSDSGKFIKGEHNLTLGNEIKITTGQRDEKQYLISYMIDRYK